MIKMFHQLEKKDVFSIGLLGSTFIKNMTKSNETIKKKEKSGIHPKKVTQKQTKQNQPVLLFVLTPEILPTTTNCRRHILYQFSVTSIMPLKRQIILWTRNKKS